MATSLLLFLLSSLSLAVSVLSTVEVWGDFGSSRRRGDPDLSHGLQLRRWFLAAIGAASGARTVCTVLEVLYDYFCELLSSTPATVVLLTFRVIPSLFFFTTYSLLAVYFAQLCYTVNGLPFFHVRNVWFFANFGLYLIVAVSIIFLVDPPLVYGTFVFAYLLNIGTFTWFGVSVFKFIPSGQQSPSSAVRGLMSTPTHSRTAAAGEGTALNQLNSSIEKIVSRLLPIIIVCSTGMSLSAINFLLLAIQVLPKANEGGSSIEFALVLVSEVLPSMGFLFLIPKQDNAYDEPSLLSIVVRATSLLSMGEQHNEAHSVMHSPVGKGQLYQSINVESLK